MFSTAQSKGFIVRNNALVYVRGVGDTITITGSYATTTTTDSMRTNIYAAINGKQATLGNGSVTNAMLAGSINYSKMDGATVPTWNQNTSGTSAGLSADIAESRVTNLVSDLAAKAPLVSPSFTTPVLGAATGTSLATTGAITSSGGGIGYATGNGGAVTQATNKSTGVTLNKLTGEVTLNNAALAAAAIVSFTLTNSTVAVTDQILVQHQATGTFGAYTINARAANGSAIFSIRNNTAGSLGEAIVIRYTVIKAVSN